MPVLQASDGNDYNFPDGTTADVAQKFLRSKGLTMRGAAQSGATVTGEFDPNIPSAGAPVAMLGGRGITSGMAKSGEAAAEKASETIKKGVILATSMTPFIAAAPFTGGMSIPAGAATMGAAGLASGVIREGGEKLAGGPNKSALDLAKTLSLDTLFGAGTEVGLRAIPALGGKLLENLALRASGKSAAGKLAITKLESAAHEEVQGLVANRTADVRKAYGDFLTKLAQIPKGKGQVGQHLAGYPEGQVGDLASEITKDLASGQLTQPMDALVRMHSSANQMAFDLIRSGKGASAPARKAVAEFADDLRGLITQGMSPAEKNVFEAAKQITKTRMEADVATSLAETLTKRALVGTIGGALTHSIPGGAAAAGASAAADVVTKKYAPVVLQYLISHEKLAFNQAVKSLSGATPAAAKATADEMFRLLPRTLTQAMTKEAAVAKTKPETEETP